MLKSENGCVEFRGEPENITSDLACAIRAAKVILSNSMSEEQAKLKIARTIEIGLMTEEELKAEREKVMKEFERGLTATLAKAMLMDD